MCANLSTANVYSNGESEVVLGKAIKKLNVPRSSLVIMTKVFMAVADNVDAPYLTNPDEEGYVNRHGLSRKVGYQTDAADSSTSSSPSKTPSSVLTLTTLMCFSVTGLIMTRLSRKRYVMLVTD